MTTRLLRLSRTHHPIVYYSPSLSAFNAAQLHERVLTLISTHFLKQIGSSHNRIVTTSKRVLVTNRTQKGKTTKNKMHRKKLKAASYDTSTTNEHPENMSIQDDDKRKTWKHIKGGGGTKITSLSAPSGLEANLGAAPREYSPQHQIRPRHINTIATLRGCRRNHPVLLRINSGELRRCPWTVHWCW